MNITCIICSDTLTPSAEIFATQCGHIFHYSCVMQWMERSKTCPQCRQRATDKTIHRVYFNLANTDHIHDDVATLQSKIDSTNYQLKLKEKDVQNFTEKYKKIKTQNIGLRKEVADLEDKLRVHDSLVHALKDQIGFFKARSKERDRLNEEVTRLKNKLKDSEAVQLAINGTREEVNDMLRNQNNVESLAILAATLKKTLLDTEKRKSNLEYKNKQTMNDVTKYRREVAQLENTNNELMHNLETSTARWADEKQYLTKIITDLKSETRSSRVETPTIHRILTESPMPLPKSLTTGFIDLNDTESPNMKESVSKILDSDSPYLRVKPTMNLQALSKFKQYSPENKKATVAIVDADVPYLPVKPIMNLQASLSKFKQFSSEAKKMSIFKGGNHMLEGAGKEISRSSDAVYNGLGGHSKQDFFPSPKNTLAGVKRHKPSSAVSSAKFRKLAPGLPFKKN